MSYTKNSPQPSGLADGETAVTLDSGDIVAIAAPCSADKISGCVVVAVSARVINADGTNKLDDQGNPIAVDFKHQTCTQEVSEAGDINTVIKCSMLAALGEPTTPLWTDPICATMLSDASIRTKIAAAAQLGEVDTGNLL